MGTILLYGVVRKLARQGEEKKKTFTTETHHHQV